MGYLIDTNVLLRIVQPSHPMHSQARSAVRALLRQRELVNVVPQVLFEFWVVATRPTTNNGLGLSPRQTRRRIEKALSILPLVPDTQAIYSEWLRLVDTYSVCGTNAHDARLVAAMKVHGLTHLLTFNLDDFKRFQNTEITSITPQEVLNGATAAN